jgi:hypothetical protein
MSCASLRPGTSLYGQGVAMRRTGSRKGKDFSMEAELDRAGGDAEVKSKGGRTWAGMGFQTMGALATCGT